MNSGLCRSGEVKRVGPVRPHRMAALFLLLACELAVAAPRSGVDRAALDKILGANSLTWQFSQTGSVERLDGVPVLCSGAQPLTLSGSELFPVDVEYRLVCRFIPSAGASASVHFQIGLKGPADPTATSPGVHLSGAANQSYVQWYVAGGTNGWKCNGTYILKAVTTRSLAWPEALRKSVEVDMAQLPDLTNKWLTVRYVVRKASIETYLDDRLLDIRTGDNLDSAGSMRITASPNVAIAALRVRALPPDDPVYRPITIGGLLNAVLFNGKPVDRNTLPQADAPGMVGGVPFVFPQPDFRGNDHISLFGSWAQFGALETYVESMGGEFGGRWPTALTVNPARIQLRVPNDHYVRLHVIAAASDEPDSVPIITAQFYKALSGFPESFGTRVPLFTAQAKDVVKLPVKLQGGKGGSLYLVTIELDPGRLSKLGRVTPLKEGTNPVENPGFWNGDLPILEMELTKGVQLYRAYPDPSCYSEHSAGLPSSVHVYALTLERAPLRMGFEPDQIGHVWTVPATPSYTVTLGNRTAAPRAVELTLATLSHDGSEKTEQKQSVTVAPGDKDVPIKFAIGNLKRFGYHDVILTLKDGAQIWTEKRSLAYLPADTRERGNWEDGRGPILGYWNWSGGHETPGQMAELRVMAQAGAETRLNPFDANTPPDALAFAQEHRFVSLSRFNSAAVYDMAFFDAALKEKWDSGDRAQASAALLKRLKEREIAPGPLNRGEMMTVFPEPGIWPSTFFIQPEFYGEPEYKLTPGEEKVFKDYLEKFLLGARLVRTNWPGVKILLPHGDPNFVIPFLRHSEEVRQLIDGIGLDMPGFERMPESQMHQVVEHRLYQAVSEFKKYGKKPVLAMCEGVCVPSQPGALTWDEQADISVRNLLLLFAYGVDRHPSSNAPFDCAGYWGEEHYGCGWCSRLPYAAPKPAYVGYATMSRHLNRANFVKWLPTGSRSVYALQFKHYKTGKLIHVFWTIRGTRPMILDVGVRSQKPEARITVYDEDDNPTELAEKDGKVTFTIGSSPCYVEGLTADPAIALGAPDHSDAQPAPGARKLGNLGDGSWKISAERDLIYENNMPMQIVRFPGKMSVASSVAPAEQGGKALAVHLEKQDKERKVMPFYTTLVPPKPIAIPGKASHLGLWVHAASDWGRVVYCLRDARGQRWVSIGTKESWNCDDTHQWSTFCFDGWRYLRFELPASAPYDNFRELGTTWWGHHGPGEGVVNLPLRLEKLIVERRTHTMYVNDPQPAKPDDVLLGDLLAEYATAFDTTDAAVRQSRIRMAVPGNAAGLSNPIRDLEAKGVGAPVAIARVDPPAHEYDGTRCLVYFDKAPNAVTYDVWVSPYVDGNGAVQLGTAWKEPGQLIAGLRPEIEFYAFVVYTDKDGKRSKPSKPFTFALKDMFPMK